MQTEKQHLDPASISDPMALMQEWLTAASEKIALNYNAAALATVSSASKPDVRYVLVKEINKTGVHFYTNRDSAKGQQLLSMPHAALALYWRELGRQLRINGPVAELDRESTAAYFSTRSRPSQLGAWASHQSQPLSDRTELHGHYKLAEQRYANQDVPVPDYWTGFCLTPEKIEFWCEGEHRLHERLQYARDPNGAWQTRRLYP